MEIMYKLIDCVMKEESIFSLESKRKKKEFFVSFYSWVSHKQEILCKSKKKKKEKRKKRLFVIWYNKNCCCKCFWSLDDAKLKSSWIRLNKRLLIFLFPRKKKKAVRKKRKKESSGRWDWIII